MRSLPRYLFMLFAVAAALFVAACGDDDESSSPSSASAETGSADEASCTPAHEFPTLEPGKLKVVGFELAPYTTFAGGEASGIDVDIIEKIAEMECLELEIEEAASAAVIPAVQTKRADLAIGDWNRTREREDIINQSDPLYLDVVAFVSKDGVAAPADVKGKKVASVAGAYWNEELEKFADGELKLYQGWGQLYDDLRAGRVDVGMTSFAQASATLEEKGGDLKVVRAAPDPNFSASEKPGQANLPHTKGNDAMKEALNADIATLKGDGTFADIVEKWGLDRNVVETGPPDFK